MTIKQVSIGFYLGATLQVDGVNWVKPSVSGNVLIDCEQGQLPTEDEVKTAWGFLMKRITDHSKDMFSVIEDGVRHVPKGGVGKDHSIEVVSAAEEAAAGEVYG